MTKHYLKISLRNMRRFKLQTIVCVTGLAVGMTCFALGTLWLRYIESFEDFVPDAENVYFVTSGQKGTGHGFGYYTHNVLGQALQDSIAAVESYCCILHHLEGEDEKKVGLSAASDGSNPMLFEVNEVDSLFFPFFGVKALRGSVDRLMPNDIVLTESAAKRLFGSTSAAVGKMLTKTTFTEIEEEAKGNPFGMERVRTSLNVAAVVKDCPRNTQFHYDVLMPFSELLSLSDPYSHKEFCTFVRLNRNARTDGFVGVPFQQTMFKPFNGPELKEDCLLVPLCHLRTDFPSENIEIKTEFVHWFMLLGLLVIACSLCNCLITMTSHLRRRGWEFSLRRVLGSSRVHIIYMVCFETLLTFLLATLLGFLFTLLSLPYFREYSGIDLPLDDIVPRLCAYLALVIVCGMVLSALTAWIVMWRTQWNILSSRSLSPRSGGLKGAWGVLVQMALSMGIIFALVIMLRQVNMLMYSDEIGFRHDGMGVVTIPYWSPSEELSAKVRQTPLAEELIENRLEMFPRNYPYETKLRSRKEGEELDAEIVHIDSAYIRFYGFQLVCGHLPEPKKFKVGGDNDDTVANPDFVPYPMDVCVNEAMCRALKVTPEQAIGITLSEGDGHFEHRIGGVVKDMYILGPTIQPKPVVYRHLEDFGVVWGGFLFRTASGRTQELCDSIKRWGEEFGAEFTVINCEREYEKYVRSEQMLIKILLAVGGASLFVCVIGTFSLVSLALQRRRKEIAIRKVHGARMKDILRLFLRAQVLSLLLAALIAYPVAYIIIRHWLEGYAKQVGIDWWLIPTTFLTIAAVVLGTITLKIWRAAKESTVEALNS